VNPLLDAYVESRTVEDGDCLRWTGYTFGGHPGGTVDRRKVLIRRALWESEHGPIPAGRIIRCTCETPRCVAIEHLVCTTMKRLTKQLGAGGVMSGPVRSARIAAAKRAGKQARVSQEDVRAIRASDEPGKVLAARYGLSESTISKYRRNQCHREFVANPWVGLSA
jgi:hypothetical protein